MNTITVKPTQAVEFVIRSAVKSLTRPMNVYMLDITIQEVIAEGGAIGESRIVRRYEYNYDLMLKFKNGDLHLYQMIENKA